MARELEQSLMQQSLVLQSLPIALFVAPAGDSYRARRFVGGNIERLCGPDEQNDSETIGRLWKNRIHPDDAGRLEHAIDSAEQTGSYELEYRILSGDGGFRWLYERAERKPNAGSADLLGVVTDVSTRKRLEEELTHAQKLEAIGRMSGGIAHDFNNMLGVIMGSLDRIAATENLSTRGQNRLSLAMQAADSCADLTKRLLGFARRQALEPRDLDIATELERLRALFERVLGEAVVVSTECAEDMPQVHLDPSQFESAMVNLLVNARDAMPEGGKVTISAARIEVTPEEAAEADLGAGEYIRLSVGDTGCGMDEATRLRALEPFFTTKPPDRGTGLGLSTIYGFIRQSGGGVRIESRVGHGTAVHMYLPAFRGPRQKKRGKRKGGAARDLRGTRVLLVEDNEKVCETAASILEGLNCEVTSAGNAVDALGLFQPGGFDLLLTDCVMPGELDGPKLAAILREKDPSLAILLTSGFHESVNDLDRRTTAFIAKPYSADQLAEKIGEAMMQAGGGEGSPP
jgi:signal transduction histidine kinase